MSVSERGRERETYAAIRSCPGLLNWTVFFFTKEVDYQPRYESVCHSVCLFSLWLTLSLASMLAAAAS